MFVILVVCASILHFFIVGQLHAYDHIKPHIESTYNVTDTMIVGSSTMGLTVGSQILSAFLISRFPDRRSQLVFILVGLLFWFIGVFASTYTHTFLDFFGVYTAFVGVGGSLVIWTSTHLILQLEHAAYHSLPIYLVATAGSLGDVTYAFGVAPSLGVNWQSTMRTYSLCGLGLGSLGVFVLYCIKPAKYTLVASEDNGRVGFVVYSLLVATVALGSFSLMAPQEVLGQEMDMMGLEAYIPTISATYSVGVLIGKFVPLAVIPWYKPTLFPFAISYLVSVGLLSVWFAVVDLSSAVAFAILSGVAYGMCTSFLMGVVHKLGGSKAYLYLIPFTLFQLPGLVTCGLLYDAMGGDAKAIMIGVFQGLAAVAALLAVYLAQKQTRRKTKNAVSNANAPS